uniref:histone acetyltransferase n=1 Tax=Ficedula albicollis TaxID=59894 RepID=A0A803VP22_FICAL
MTEEVPPTALTDVNLRLLCHDDIDTVKQLCGDWFPIEYPDSWYRDITSNKKFFSLAATYRGSIVGMIVAEIKSRTKVHKEVCDYPGLQQDRIHPCCGERGWNLSGVFPSPVQTLDAELINEGMKHVQLMEQGWGVVPQRLFLLGHGPVGS